MALQNINNAILGKKNLGKLNAMFTALFARPAVQSAKFGAAGATVDFSTETGWVIVRSLGGLYTITFPTAASAADAQCVVATRSDTDSGGAYRSVEIVSLSTTGCLARVTELDGTLGDADFAIMRTVG